MSGGLIGRKCCFTSVMTGGVASTGHPIRGSIMDSFCATWPIIRHFVPQIPDGAIYEGLEDMLFGCSHFYTPDSTVGLGLVIM